MGPLIKRISEATLRGDKNQVTCLVEQGLSEGISAEDMLNEAFIPAMDEVGDRFECGEAYIPEMLISAKSMQAGLALLKPHLIEKGIKPIGKVAVGSVKGDLHDIGKNLVGMMLEGAGFEILDLGVDVQVETFINSIKEGIDILAMSALLTTTMPELENVISEIRNAGLRDKVIIMVGGAPVTPEYAKNINADGYAPDASQAVAVVRDLYLK